MPVFVEDASNEADELRFFCLGTLLHEVGCHERSDGKALQMLVVFMIHQRVANLVNGWGDKLEA